MPLIGRDLCAVRQIADKGAVMYQLMEIGATAAVFTPRFHPYTHGLILAVPRSSVHHEFAEFDAHNSHAACPSRRDGPVAYPRAG